MIESIERCFGQVNQLPRAIEWLSDNGSAYTARETRAFARTIGFVPLTTTYDRYIGEYVLHCHILDHVDSGMMANIAVAPDLSAPGDGLGMPGMKTMSNGKMTHGMQRQ